MLDTALQCVILILSSALFASRRLSQYLRFFQQEQYISDKFLSWLWRHRAFDTRGTLALIPALLIAGFSLKHANLAAAIAALLILVAAFYEQNPQSTGKLVLVMTERARRIYHTAVLLYLSLAIIALLFSLDLSHTLAYMMALQLVLFQALPLVLLFSNLLLLPAEKRIQDGFRGEAMAKLARVNPYVIGITGSYGKTSTKAILGELLHVSLGPTFWPREGINSPMGITRALRENLKDAHRYAVIEMGAFKRGSIKRLCELTPPKAAIITAVGEMHLDRFEGRENVCLAKSELAQAVPEDGILVCNADNPGSRRIAEEFPKKTSLLYSLEADSENAYCRASNIAFSPHGTSFSIECEGRIFEAKTSLLGRTAVSNILASLTMGFALGADPEHMLAAIYNLKPVDNRLELRCEGEVSYLRDAYNSNPAGFRAALEVLQAFDAKRRVLVTPGMIELGDEQFPANRDIGALAAKVCDLVIIVGNTNSEALLEGLKSSGFADKQVMVIETRNEALSELSKLRKGGDIVLIENDLPDLYEAVPRF